MGAEDFSRAVGVIVAAALTGTSVVANAQTIEGTRWHVARINTHATPTTADYFVEFRGGAFNGKFGCNPINGHYSILSERITLGKLQATKMRCPDLDTAFETAGIGILHRPMSIRWNGNSRLRLSNRVGTIDLEQLP